MKRIIILFSISLILLSINSISAEEDNFEKYGFFVDYPKNWEILDNWNAGQLSFKSDLRNNAIITIEYQKSLLEISEVKNELLDLIIVNEGAACRNNRNGPCWNFDVIDSKIIQIAGKKSISLSWEATLKDVDTTIKMVLIPDGAYNWLITGKIKENPNDSEHEELIDTAIVSFMPLKMTPPKYTSTNTDQETKTIPTWIKNIVKWWSDGTIGDAEFINAIKYLVENKIININEK